ncbi:MAG: sulfatase-like hydrolase/transferase [Deltaproteobacteria bacterium]|nr:sulfatase-like hydrolase/transferase [Deltaproteobacteria bacterium]
MNRRDFLRLLGAGAMSMAMPGISAAKSKSNNPNIIFILTDDMGPWAFGAAGDKNARTPNLDKLRAAGARLTNCYSPTPVCSPARASIMTSRYGTELGITDYIKPSLKIGLGQEFVTWPRLLEKAGYSTALVGKWHLGDEDEFYPTNFGYQEFTGFRAGGATSLDPKVEIDRKVRTVKGYTPDILTDHAMDFIRRKKQGPFLLSLHFWAPHANTKNRTPDGDRTWLPLSDADWTKFKDMDPSIPNPDYPNLDIARVKRMMREYLGSIASVDRNIGRVTQLLDELDLSDNTVIIFTSDHGFNMGHNGIWHKGNGRWILTTNDGSRPNMYDNSMLVPALIRWPKVIKPGTTVDQTLTHLDWLPTIAAMAGTAAADDAVIHGRNFLPLLKGRKPKWDNDLFAQYNMRGAGDMRTYYSGRWKLVRDFKHKIKDEFYDIESDPAEHNNLIDSPDPKIQKQIKKLDAKLLQKMRSINDIIKLPANKPKRRT